MPGQLYVVWDYRTLFDKAYVTLPRSVAFFFFFSKKCYGYDLTKDDEEPVLFCYGTKCKKIS